VARPKKNYDEKILKELIINFHNNFNTNSLVKPIDVFNFSSQEYINGKFPYKLTYDFWKKSDRLGRQLINQFNAVRKTNYSISESDNYDLVDVQDLLDKYCSENRETLAKYLIPMEKQLRRLIAKLEKKNKIISDLELEKAQFKKKIEDEKLKSQKMQTLLYQMFSYGPSGARLDNLSNTGTSRTERVSNALKNAFNEPTEFLEGLEQRVSVTNQDKVKNNVVKFAQLNQENDDWDL